MNSPQKPPQHTHPSHIEKPGCRIAVVVVGPGPQNLPEPRMQPGDGFAVSDTLRTLCLSLNQSDADEWIIKHHYPDPRPLSQQELTKCKALNLTLVPGEVMHFSN